MPQDLQYMLSMTNGFYTFESALHVFPLCTHSEHMTLKRWNETATWKASYGAFVDPVLCFAEDTVGEQFAIYDGSVVRFNPESGEICTLAPNIEAWAGEILAGYEGLTAYPLAHQWQEQFRLLREGERLIPKTPFIFGGEYSTNNLYALNSEAAMRLRGDTFQQIRDLPDGATVRLSVTD
jgi:hypothetical protein